ncbi:MAG: saccharopine dehydrogenase family protein [Candidatus Eisenbacteria bacterium]
MRILVLGGGQQGRVIATDLARALPDRRVSVADLRRPALQALGNLEWIELDAADAGALERLVAAHDLVVGALPSRYGFGSMRAAIAVRRPMVDVSFSAEDPLDLDADARAAGVTLVPDCGLAPGLSHLLVGHAATRAMPDEAVIYVGGVARDPSRPYGYTVTWSLDDLLEEYVRPARIVKDGAPVTVPVFSGLDRVHVEGAGEMESFLSDGLRTLVTTLPIRDMSERTLRWPGHVALVQPLLAGGRFLDEFRQRCVADPPDDLVALLVRIRHGARWQRAGFVDRYDPTSGLSAMARTTALTTAAMARLVAEGLALPAGVQPLERAARVDGVWDGMRSILAGHRVRLEDFAPEPVVGAHV